MGRLALIQRRMCVFMGTPCHRLGMATIHSAYLCLAKIYRLEQGTE